MEVFGELPPLENSGINLDTVRDSCSDNTIDKHQLSLYDSPPQQDNQETSTQGWSTCRTPWEQDTVAASLTGVRHPSDDGTSEGHTRGSKMRGSKMQENSTFQALPKMVLSRERACVFSRKRAGMFSRDDVPKTFTFSSP